MSETWAGLVIGAAFLLAAAANRRWDYMAITGARKPSIFAEVDREREEDAAAVRRGAQRFRTLFLAGLGALLVGTAVVRLLVEAVSG